MKYQLRLTREEQRKEVFLSPANLIPCKGFIDYEDALNRKSVYKTTSNFGRLAFLGLYNLFVSGVAGLAIWAATSGTPNEHSYAEKPSKDIASKLETFQDLTSEMSK